ncbi:hypothetical protein FSARC_5609 [Fusarium sarcochroum]|uniref:Extracellular membrane protein CFEM domain-containing protein n=1 Tax=Fusarium sarcochroum TaxID=1208366 RepID=A0A8H4TZE9_9HYPO|nr:hypothetical protein FSARC_5609 [Fusarium sarcochroum]
MPQLFKILVLTSALGVTPSLAATFGHFDSDVCVDSKGYEECYKDADSWNADCINKNCKGTNIDCMHACDCVLSLSAVDCALTHCWNQVYSCEYQNTVLELGNNCVDEKYENVPFFPPPDDAPGACSCNLGKVVTSLNRASDELGTCMDRNPKLWDSVADDRDEMDDFVQACECCSYSGFLSTIWGVCPDTKPSLIGPDDVYNRIILKDENYPKCADYTDKYSCVGDLKFTPPGKDKSIKFYNPGELPKNGTKTLSNLDGSITSPLSGATFTWTRGDRTRAITVASPNAKPTGTSNKKDSKEDDAKETESSGSDGGNSAEGSEDEEDAAVAVIPHLWPLVCMALAILA